MDRSMIKLALAAALMTALAGQAPPPATPSDLTGTPVATTDYVPIAIDTSLGRIVVALDRTHAPKTTANFLHYVDTHRLDGETIYRAMHVPGGKADDGLIQGGVRSDSRKLYPPIDHEPTSRTGIKNIAGAISMANGGPGTARADFFILTSDMPALDATASDPGFAAFGQVVEGMDVVKKILAAPVSPTMGEGAMKGQMLDPPVKIIKAARVK
jgi:peptidyl-prolyl cis-trans isomerase A (cyclophilin A)